MKNERVDLVLLSLFPELTRGKVQSLIEKHKIQMRTPLGDWRVVEKSGEKVNTQNIAQDSFKIFDDDELHYVSRGALKIKKAIEEFSIAVKDKICMDVGLSTGGFSDFLLQSGAACILGIDVGREQLHPRLREDARLMAFDKVNAKDPIPASILETFFQNQAIGFDLIVVDVSFISLTKIVPNLVPLLATNGALVTLIKPQFEMDKKSLNKKGVVKDPEAIGAVVEKIRQFYNTNGLKVVGHVPSPIEGENGNREVLMVSHSVKR